MSLIHREAWFPGCEGHTDRQTDRHTDISTYRKNWPKGRFFENYTFTRCVLTIMVHELGNDLTPPPFLHSQSVQFECIHRGWRVLWVLEGANKSNHAQSSTQTERPGRPTDGRICPGVSKPRSGVRRPGGMLAAAPCWSSHTRPWQAHWGRFSYPCLGKHISISLLVW